MGGLDSGQLVGGHSNPSTFVLETGWCNAKKRMNSIDQHLLVSPTSSAGSTKTSLAFGAEVCPFSALTCTGGHCHRAHTGIRPLILLGMALGYCAGQIKPNGLWKVKVMRISAELDWSSSLSKPPAGSCHFCATLPSLVHHQGRHVLIPAGAAARSLAPLKGMKSSSSGAIWHHDRVRSSAQQKAGMPAHGGDVIALQTDGTLMGRGEVLCKTPGEGSVSQGRR